MNVVQCKIVVECTQYTAPGGAHRYSLLLSKKTKVTLETECFEWF